ADPAIPLRLHITSLARGRCCGCWMVETNTGMKTEYRRLVVVVALALSIISAGATVRYVNAANLNPTPPYTDWSSAATNIQDAVDASGVGDQILVTNGVYNAGGRQSSDGMTNRVAVTNALTVQSVNGLAATSIDGRDSVRCVYLADGA